MHRDNFSFISCLHYKDCNIQGITVCLCESFSRTVREEYRLFKFKVRNSVHHRTIQINHQPDTTIFQFIILTFIYSSTCFGRFPAHLYLRIVATVVLCSWSGRPEISWTVNKRQDNKLENCCIWLVIYLNNTTLLCENRQLRRVLISRRKKGAGSNETVWKGA